MAHDLIQQRFAEGVITLTINRPAKRNALSRVMLDALRAALDAAMHAQGARVVILTGAGPAFCAGLDLEELRASANVEEAGADASAALRGLMDAIAHGPKPVIAAVNGPAVAGGAAIVSVCDVVVAADTATIGYPGVMQGIVASVVMAPLVRQVGERRARRLLLTGELMSAAVAQEVGLVDEVVPAAALADAAGQWASRLAALPAGVVAATKTALHDAVSHATDVPGARPLDPRFRLISGPDP